MATAKTSNKKPTIKRAPAKTKSTTKVIHKAAPRQPEMRSFHKAEAVPFLTFRFTQQTVYWLVLCLVVLVFGISVLNISSDIQGIYDQIDSSNQLN